MKRLVYAPKVWVFIRSSNITDENGDAKIYDVSSDLVRGTVTQNLGDLSKARFELRNRFYKWLRDRNDKNKQIFLPMDLCTIWMQRISGRPVQVFTGYLDSVPYYQAYPGNAIFEASCTLKKLAYNWFDPGLPVFINWLKSNGWAFDPSTGNVIADVDMAASGAPGGALVSNSASFADLLGRFMVDIAGWDPSDVLIGTLPPDLGEKAAALYSDIEGQTQADLQTASAFMGHILGISGSAAMDSSITSDPAGSALPPTALPTIKRIAALATKDGLPPWLLVFAGSALTGFDQSYRNANAGNPSWGYGLYALRPTVPATSQSMALVDGTPVGNLSDPSISTRIMDARLNKFKASHPDVVAKALKGDAAAAAAWVAGAIGRPIDPSKTKSLDALLKASQKVADTQTASAALQTTPTVAVQAKSTPLSDVKVQARLNSSEKNTVKTKYDGAIPELGAALLVVKSVAPLVRLAGDAAGTAQLFVTGPQADLDRLWSFYKGRQEYTRVEYKFGGKLQAYQAGALSAQSVGLQANGMLIVVDAARFDALGTLSLGFDAAALGADDGAAVEGGLTFKQLAAFSANADFAANFAFPTDIVESHLLTGDKALMNDVSCLDGVRQLCAASLRTFRSLPDGRFLSFYPDYFAAERDPYWKIYNIEITDFGIQLNDEALATHVYVIGDSFYGGDVQPYMQELASRGVATVNQDGILETFIEPLSALGSDAPDTTAGDTTEGVNFRVLDPYEFLNHYGARPHKEDQPLIRNPFYEFMMAWQKFMWLWSQQFATTATFTFQPEVMAGGVIHFPDHDVQMFCESVTHDFDYEGGFQTQAVLAAPSLPAGKRRSKISKPGFALGGAVNTVGMSG